MLFVMYMCVYKRTPKPKIKEIVFGEPYENQNIGYYNVCGVG